MHILLFLLFFVLFTSRTLGFDLSLAPGLSVKNAFLYLIFAALAIDAAMTRRYKLELLSVLVPFGMYVYYAVFTWVVVLLLLDYQGYSARTSLISLKSGPVEHFLVLLIFFYGVRTASQGIWVIRNMLWLIILGNVVTVVDALNIPDLGLIEHRFDGRVGGPIGGSNEYAAFLAAFLPAIFALFWSEEGLKKALAGAGALVSFLAFLMAVSRGAIVGLLVGCLVGAFYMRAFVPPRVMMRAGMGAVLCTVLAIVGMFFTGEYGELLLDRIGQFEAGSVNTISSGRTSIWLTALGSMAENPVTFVTGYGWDAYNAFYFRFATHNTYLGILYDLGLIGLVLMLLTFLNILRTAFSALRYAGADNRHMLMAFVFGFLSLLVALTLNALYTSWLYVWAFIGISLRLAVAEKASEAEAEDRLSSDAVEPRRAAGAGGAGP
jgi:O-antigen ligase